MAKAARRCCTEADRGRSITCEPAQMRGLKGAANATRSKEPNST
jgi:hypothetical protein